MTTASASAAAVSTAVRSSAAVETRTTVAPAGSGSDDVGGDHRDVGAAGGGGGGERVALAARRTGCRGSAPGRAARGCRRPRPRRGGRRGPEVGCSSRVRAAAKISAGSGSRPTPVSAPVSRPEAGVRTTAPRERRVATLAWVAGCSHISVCIAGANSTGQRAVSRVAVSRSSARPWAARASRSAVAGATTTRSASRPSRTWATWSTSAQTVVATGSPGQRLPGGGADEVQRRLGRDRPVPGGRSRSAAAAAHRPCTQRCRRPRPG